MLKNAKFMLILAFALASSLAIADKVAEKEIKEITDANFYSAGKTTAESIDTWMKKEIQPELFDIWLGKKTRFYLNGSWKLMKLSNTRENPKSVFGLKKGFEKKDFDDSKWFNQPVPYLWNSYFPNKRKVIVFGGIGWYRKTFTLPKTFSGKRTILAFGAVANECEVYVNGKKVGGHVNLCSDHPNGLTHQREEGFELDITDALVPNGQNTLSMKVYDDGLHYRSPKLKKMVGIGGIWQEVYLESRPAIYLKRALISPVFASSEIKVKAFVVNTLKNSVQINPSVQLSPWQSKRYTLAKGPASSVKLRSFLLSSGKNELDFTVTMENPQCWSPEHPYLYHFKLLNEKGDILGQERFGFRQFTAGQNSFKLNGKDIFLMGQQALWSSWQSAPGPSILLGELGILNRRHVIENWYDAYLGMNLNLIRTHTSHYPHSFYEIGDEQGALIYGEEHLLNSFKGDDTQMKKYYENGDLTPFLKEKIRDKAIFCYNYPSIVMRSMGNECYDQLFVNKPQGLTSWAPLLDLLYKEYKRIDPTRPVTASSGRPPTNESCRIAGAHSWASCEKYALCDFNDEHNYNMSYKNIEFAEDDNWARGYKKYYEAYALDAGVPKVTINGESNISSIIPPWWGYRKTLEKIFLPHINDGKIDRKWFAENWEVIAPDFAKTWAGEMAIDKAAAKFGFLDSVVERRAALSHADFYKRFIEQHRRKRAYVDGFVSNQPMTFVANLRLYKAGEFLDKTVLYEPVASYVRKACQPILACVSGKFNRNLIAGKNNGTDNFYVMNDSESTLFDIRLEVSARSMANPKQTHALATLKINYLIPGEMRVIPHEMTLSPALATGHYMLELNVMTSDGKKLSSNDYEAFILNKKDISPRNSQIKGKLAVYGGSESDLSGIMKDLKIPFASITDFKKLSEYKVLFVAPYAKLDPAQSKELLVWLKKGGKLVCFEQKTALISELPVSVMKTGQFGYFTEIFELDHPIFKGLRQNDFKFWNGNKSTVKNKWFFHNSYVPLHEGVLAAQVTIGRRVGMSVAEFKVGEGVCLFSQLETMKRFGTDSVATKYLLNIFDYALGEFSGKYAAKIEEATETVEVTVNDDDFILFDLAEHANMGFADETAGDKKGGWTDQGGDYDFRTFPTGKQRFQNIPFNITNPADNKNKSCIILQGPLKSKTAFLPKTVEKIKIGAQVKKLYFLVASAWESKKNPNVGGLQIVYRSDGTGMSSSDELPLKIGKNMGGWWNPRSQILSDGKVAWSGVTNGDNAVEVGCFIIEWLNPDAKRPVEYINFYSTGNAVPILIGITGEKL